MKIVLTLLVTVLTWLPAASLGAQVEPSTPPAPPAAEETARSQRGASEGDALLAAWLLMASNNEIALAGLAQQKAHSSEVKQFAQMMVGDHGRFAQKLQSIAVSATTDRGTGKAGRASDREGAGRQQPPADASGTRQAVPMGGFDHMALIRDMGKKCLEAETNLLHEKTGAEFDRCYMGMQVVGHAKAAAMIEAFGTHASEQLRPILEEGHKTVQAHLEQAKSLCKQLENGANTKTEKAEKTGSGK